MWETFSRHGWQCQMSTVTLKWINAASVEVQDRHNTRLLYLVWQKERKRCGRSLVHSKSVCVCDTFVHHVYVLMQGGVAKPQLAPQQYLSSTWPWPLTPRLICLWGATQPVMCMCMLIKLDYCLICGEYQLVFLINPWIRMPWFEAFKGSWK